MADIRERVDGAARMVCDTGDPSALLELSQRLMNGRKRRFAPRKRGRTLDKRTPDGAALVDKSGETMLD